MTKLMGIRGLIPAAVVPLILGAIPVTGSAEGGDRETPFDEANLFFELNNTDGDLGIHALIDGEPWKRLEIEDPWERKMLDIRVKGRLRRQGLTELFYESAEPSFDELDPEEFFHRFPAGEYEIEGTTLDGQELESIAELTHVLPAPPDGIRVSGKSVDPDSVDCDEGPVPVVSRRVVIDWDPVMRSHPELGVSGPIDVVKYQLVVEREEPTLLIYSVDLPPDVTRMRVPWHFIKLGDEFKFEILVREASGNQTAVESCFEIG